MKEDLRVIVSEAQAQNSGLDFNCFRSLYFLQSARACAAELFDFGAGIFFEKHVLCVSCSVNPSRLKHQIVGSRYRRCCIWCTRNAISYPSMALGKAFRYPLSLFLQSTSWDKWESFGSAFFPKASAGGFLLGYARVEFDGF